MVEKIDALIPGGTKAATTIPSGKNKTKALPARATLRSTNSISPPRPHLPGQILLRPVEGRLDQIAHSGNLR